jgi:hypothetical protein
MIYIFIDTQYDNIPFDVTAAIVERLRLPIINLDRLTQKPFLCIKASNWTL